MKPHVEELEPRCVLSAAQTELVRELLPPPKIEPLPITIFTNPPIPADAEMKPFGYVKPPPQVILPARELLPPPKEVIDP